MNQWFKRMWALVLAILLTVGLLPAPAYAAETTSGSVSTLSSTKVPVPSNRVYITSAHYSIVPGAEETVLTTNNASGTDQCIGYILEVSQGDYANGDLQIVACYKDYSYDELGFQTVTDQAAAYEKAHPEAKVVAAINADFFNMTTGEPSGAFVMDGTIYHKASSRPYFAILKDGTAVIREGNVPMDDVLQAVGGNDIIVVDGQVDVGTTDYELAKYSRTAIGIRADGSIVTYVTHGISAPTSCGETNADIAADLVAQGCVTALMLDGGGSTTYASVREGTDTLTVQNSPSDGTPRTVSTTLLVVSTAKSDGVFDHASLTPNNEYYTPTISDDYLTTVQFEAVGVDASGTKCALPESGLSWALAADYESAGSINAETGVFTAAKNYLGTVGVELLYNNEVVGSTEIQIVEPEEIAFSGTGISLDFGEVSDLGLTVKGNGVVLNHKVGDFAWVIDCTTDGVDNDTFATMSGNDLVCGAKQNVSMEGNVSATYTRLDGTALTAEIFVEVGKMPIVALDFEEGDDFQVGLWDWGASGSYFTTGLQHTYTFDNTDVVYYLRRQYWNGSSWVNTGDSAWIENCYSTEQPWEENEDGSVTMTYIKGESGWDDNKLLNGQKTETYGVDGEVWVVYGDIDGELVKNQSVRYAWTVYLESSVFSGNYNANRPAATLLAANGYDMYVWHTNANPTDEANNGLHGEGSQVVSSSEGEVRFGDYALKLTYDFRNFSPTGSTKNCNTYYRLTDPLIAEGSPTGLGMWVYAPEGMSNFWFWTCVQFWNGSAWTSSYIHYKPAGAEKTCQYTGVNWTGWTYVEADLSAIYAAGAVVDEEHPVQIRDGESLILLTYIPGGTSDGEGHAIVCGSKSAGYFYIDNVRWVYGTNVDDMDSPVIVSASANDTALSATETVTLTSNDISFSVDFTDPQGENYSGIDETATQIYLDGSVLSSSDFAATADRAQTIEMKLANGEHTLKVSICDNFGNRTEQTYSFVINNESSDIPAINIIRNEKAELGGDYNITISTDNLSDIASVSTTIVYDDITKFEDKYVTMDGSHFYDDYGNLLTVADDGKCYDAEGNYIEEPLRVAGTFPISNAHQKLGENLTGTIRNKTIIEANTTRRAFTATATVNESLSSDNTILTFTLPVPYTLTELDYVPYTVTVTYTTVDGAAYTVTSGSCKAELWACYTIDPGIQISGAENGTITVTANDGSEVDTENLNVYVGDTALEGTWNGNVFTTSYFTSLDANTTVGSVYVGDAVNQHYSFKYSVNVCRFADAGAYDVILNATTGDSNTMQQITWLSGKDTDPGNVQVQYMTKAAYEAALASAAEGEDVFAGAACVTGSSVLTDFILGGVDLVAAYINNATLTGLTPGTEYVCRVSDGSRWSDVTNFSTYTDDGSTDFVVMGDAQLHGNDESDADAIASLQQVGQLNADVDFGIQTGDFVDGGTNYTQWEQIVRQFGNAFEGIDFVHTMGNHEVYTSDGTPGTVITTRLYGLTSAQTKFYSVEYGNVYVAVINQAATSDLQEAAEWLIEDAAKTECTWKILIVHQPVYFTNPNGSSEGHNQILAPACDAAGIDFVFSGHDHAYARTEQMFNGTPVDLTTDPDTNVYVDANGNAVATQGQGTVYFIVGSLDPGGEYAVVDNPNFHFATATNSYNSLYLTVEATDGKFSVKTWDMTASGTAELIDTYTMYNGIGICQETGTHVITDNAALYNPETGMLVCERCGDEIDPAELSYTGYATDINGADEYGDSQYYFFLGALKTGWFPMGTDFVYANENGLIDHAVVNYSTNTCTSSGKNMAYSPRYDLTYTGGVARYTGHNYVENENGELVCTNTYYVTSENGYEEVACNHTAIDIADWNFSLNYSSVTYTGSAKVIAIIIENPETGDTLTFHTDGTGIMSDYFRTWSNNKNVGTATVAIEANPNGDYTNSNGIVTLSLRICPPAPTGLTATPVDETSVYLSWNASAQTDCYRIYRHNTEGTWTFIGETTDTNYTVTGLNAETTYEFAVRSKTVVDGETYTSLSYSQSATAETGAGRSIADDDISVTLSFTKTTYNGNNKRPTPTVKDAEGNTLVCNTDYSVTWVDNVNAGTGKVIITGKGSYVGQRVVEFTIARQSLTNTASVTADNAVYVADGAATTSVTVVDMNGYTLTEGIDYTLSYTNNTSVGIATVNVTGIGNYTGSASATFTISAKSIEGMTAEVSTETGLVYTGTEITPDVLVNGLVEGQDYTVSYENNVNAGEATAIVTGIGNYAGSLKVIFTIVPTSIEGASITDAAVYSYTGLPVEADINVITESGVALVKDIDYAVVSYENNIDAGTATVTISGIGNYTGTLKHDYVIQEADLQNFTVELEPETFVFTGGYKTPTVHVKNVADEELTEGVDYSVALSNNRNAGSATVTITGIGNYVGEVTKVFTITPADIGGCTVTLSYSTTTYSGVYKTPSVVVKTAKGTTLLKGTNYTVSYLNNKDAGTATVVVTGMGNYAGTIEKTFTINHADLTKCTVTLSGTSFDQTGEEIEPDVTVKTAKGTMLRKGLNYTVTYQNNVTAGEASVIVTGIGNYAGTLISTFTINQARSITGKGFTATLQYTKMTYTGEARCPSVTLTTPAGTVLKKGTNYTVTYTNNVEIGTATVTITGIGKYSGTITKTFSIVPEKVETLRVVSTTDSTVTVNFQHLDSADKYYIYVDGVYYGCSVTLSTYKIKGLESGKTYTISVKSVAVVNGKNYVSLSGNKVTATTK